VNRLSQRAVAAMFKACYGNDAQWLVSAPGRVNLIGEHTDYNGGFVLPMAIDYRVWIAVEPTDNRVIEIVAANVSREHVSINLDLPVQSDPDHAWSNYVRGVIQQLQQGGYRLTGGRWLIAGDVPEGAGLSSSAALEMAVIRALTCSSGESVDAVVAAKIGQAAENEFVGCQCGIMDQLISACGEENHALLIDCHSLDVKPVAIPKQWGVLIVHSGVKRGLVGSEYNLRRQQCEQAAVDMDVASLRDATLEQMLSAETQMDPIVFRRARHVLTENVRTRTAAQALASQDLDTLVTTMKTSHDSMRDDFGITTPEIDLLVNLLSDAGEGQCGARMTGGGFGGCVVVVAPIERIPSLEAAVRARYFEQTGCRPRFYVVKASDGAFRLPCSPVESL